MKIVIAIDSFKGSASSSALNAAAASGVLSAYPSAEVVSFAIADGGEGTLEALRARLSGELISVETVDLLRQPLTAHYLLAGETAVIESAEVVGIDKIKPSPETIQQATTYGLAALVLDAAKRGAREIILTLGGTGTSDGGLGLLEGLGVDLEGLTNLPVLPRLTGLADVTNPYAGETGYARFFGEQKGGTVEILAAEDAAATHFTQKVEARFGLDLQDIPGTGAAGGLGGAIAILGGQISPGFPKVAELLGIEDELADADLVLTGEGRMDFQTANGKVPYGMALLARKYSVPTIALCGALGDDLGQMDELLLASYSVQRAALPLRQAMETQRTLVNMERLARGVVRTYFRRF